MHKSFYILPLLISLLFSVNSLSGQSLLYSGQFFYNNNVISQTDLETVLMENPEAFALYKKTNSLDRTAKLFRNIGRVIFGVGTILTLADGGTNLDNIQRSSTIAIIGAPFAIGGLTMQLINQKKRKMIKVADIYNNSTLNSEGNKKISELHFCLSSSGIGFSIKF